MPETIRQTNTSTNVDNIYLLDQAPDWWDQRIAEHGGLLTSSVAWATLIRKLGIGQGRFLVAERRGEPALAMLVCDMLIGGLWLSGWLPRPVLLLISRLPFLRAYWASLQPVILQPHLLEEQDALLDFSVAVFDFLARHAQAKHLGGVFPLSYVPFQSIDYAYRLAKELEPLGYNCDMVGTVRLDLSGGEEAVKSQMDRKSARHSITRGERQSITIDWLYGKKQITKYVRAMNRSWRGKGMLPDPPRYYHLWVRHLPPNSVKLLVARHEGKIVAGSTLFLFGKTILENSMFSTPESRDKKLVAGDVVKWATLKHGIEEGYQQFDFNHITIPEGDGQVVEDKAIRGINFYKLKWGGIPTYGVRLTLLGSGFQALRSLKAKLVGG